MQNNKDKRHLAKTIALLGTGSDVGKSIVVAALCRIYRNRGIAVAPYKAQNMSNNSYVTPEGGEMGRAQVVQAEACRLAPHTDMNPVLLKPNTDLGSQVVLQGKAIGNSEASNYFRDTSHLFTKARESLTRLRDQYELIVIEGAGSCAEVNLRARDFVNFETAHAADAPVILVADIDRGGVFAQIVGSLQVMPPKDRQRVAGFIINKFRGDPTLFADGIRYLEESTGLPVLGLIPYFRNIEIDSEDGMPLETIIDPPSRPIPHKINIAAIRLPHISNFTDFNPLIRHPSICFHYLTKPRDLNGYQALILPGTKNVRFDLQWLQDSGWEPIIKNYASQNDSLILGVCGGFQMLGTSIHDPHGVEGSPGSSAGLALLDAETTLEKNKVLSRTRGTLFDGSPFEGYEIHMGMTKLGPSAKPLATITARNTIPQTGTDGAISPNERILGTYFHGLFDFPGFRQFFLNSISASEREANATATNHAAFGENNDTFKQSQYDLLAEHFAKHLDMAKLDQIIFGNTLKPAETPTFPLVVPPSGGSPSTTTYPPIPTKARTTNPPFPPLVVPPSGGSPSPHHEHGGTPLATFQRLGISPHPVIDFSVNISPLGLPDIIQEQWPALLEQVTQYPSAAGNGLKQYYTHRFHLPDECILPGNGSIDLIYAIPRTLGFQTIAIPQPAFHDYSRASSLAGAHIVMDWPDSFQGIDAIFIGNPNNPNGQLRTSEELLQYAEANPKTTFIVDEAFMPFIKDASKYSLMCPECIRPNIIVLHSLTKVFAIPGLRLGACISAPETIARLQNQRPPWMLNGLAETIAPLLADCHDYEDKLTSMITSERQRIYKALASIPSLAPIPGARANFILVQWKGSPDLDDLLKNLLVQGLFVRDARNFPTCEHQFFRMAIRTPADNDLLLEALRTC